MEPKDTMTLRLGGGGRGGNQTKLEMAKIRPDRKRCVAGCSTLQVPKDT